MDEKIDFGTIGVKIGDIITFQGNDTLFSVTSGNGTPGNGGTLIGYADYSIVGSFSIRYLTKRLLGVELTDDIDVFELWSYKGRTLRSIYNENIEKGRR